MLIHLKTNRIFSNSMDNVRRITRIMSSSVEVCKLVLLEAKDTSISLEWVPKVDARSYRIEYNRIPDGPYNMQTTCSNKFIIENLRPETSYKIRINSIPGVLSKSEQLIEEIVTTAKV